MKKFRNKYRIPSSRATFWDYGWNGAYFVTICTKGMEAHFGRVAGEKMILSEIGQIAKKCWLAIPNHFPFVKLDVHVIMPNHVHGIIIIDKADVEMGEITDNENQSPLVETQNLASLQNHTSLPKNKFGPQSRNLPSIIRGFKAGVTKQARTILPEFSWQPRYHDHIIRNDESWNRIANYIVNNPLNWQTDKFYI
ncbi:MAG: hypothetical protein AAGI38_25375 [Bacteroidota bacterium]